MTTWLEAEVEKADRYHARNQRFEARLFPVNRICDVPWPSNRYETFTRSAFDYAAKHLLDEGEGRPVIVDHDETKRIGEVVRLWGDDTWIRCQFRIDVDNDYAWGIHRMLLRNVGYPGVNPPVSAGYVPETTLPAGQLEGGRIVAIADLTELSLLIRRKVQQDLRFRVRRATHSERRPSRKVQYHDAEPSDFRPARVRACTARRSGSPRRAEHSLAAQ